MRRRVYDKRFVDLMNEYLKDDDVHNENQIENKKEIEKDNQFYRFVNRLKTTFYQKLIKPLKNIKHIKHENRK